MALDESALPELLAALRAGDGVDLIRDAVRMVFQELIELRSTRTMATTDETFSHRNGPGSTGSWVQRVLRLNEQAVVRPADPSDYSHRRTRARCSIV
jgi:hypothetical protein